MLRETDLINTDLEGYHIATELDSHAGSRIFLGESISLNTPSQRVLIKVLTITHADIQQEQQHILQMLSVLQKLHHPHILPIQSIGIYKDMPYLISEYITSGSLQDRLQNSYKGQPMPLEEALPILTQIGKALHYAHQQHIVHGNLKPQNVLLNIQDDVLVTDFHLHLLLPAEKTEDTHPLEISTYWAPEQLSGQSSEESDQYAFSCIAYEMLTGNKAFMVPSVKSPGTYYKTKALIAPGRFNEALPSYIDEAILKAMSKEPSERYPNIQAFLVAMGIVPILEDAEQQKEDIAPDLPVTPLPAIDATTLARMDAIASKKTLIPASTEDATPLAPQTASKASFLPVTLGLPRQALLKANSRPLKISLLSGAINRPPFQQAWQRLSGLKRRTVIMGLLAIAIVIGSLLLSFSALAPAKKLGTIAHTSTNTTTQFPSQTRIPKATKTVLSTSSSTPGIVPSSPGVLSNATPPLTLLPTQTGAITPGPTFTAIPTPGATHGASPEPTPTQDSDPKPAPPPVPTPTPVQAPPPAPAPTPTPVQASTPVQVSLGSFFNNNGIGYRPGMANFDGSGFSYPTQLMPPGGLITVQGISYQFPGNAPGRNDNVIPFGQNIALVPGNYRRAYLLASASWGPASGTITIHYTDGSTSTTLLTAPDWCSGSSNALSAPYRYSPNRSIQNIISIYALPIMLDARRTADMIFLPRAQSGPYQSSRIHIFALTLQP